MSQKNRNYNMKSRKLTILYSLIACSLIFFSCSNHKKAIKSLFILSDEDVCKENMRIFESKIQAGKYFDWNEDKEDYYLNDEYKEDYNTLLSFHKSHQHPVCNNDSLEWKQWMYFRHNGNYKEQQEYVTACPFCRYLDDCLEEDPEFSADNDFLFDHKKLNYFNTLLLPEYETRKNAKIAELEKKRLPSDWKECRLIGFNYRTSAALYGYYLPSPFKNKKAGTVFDKKNILSKEKDTGTYGVLKDINVFKSDYKAKFDYECYAVSDRPDTYGQVKKMGDLSFTVKFSPSDKTAFIYSATIKTESSGKSQTFEYDGVIYDEESMANAVEGFLVWIIDTDKL